MSLFYGVFNNNSIVCSDLYSGLDSLDNDENLNIEIFSYDNLYLKKYDVGAYLDVGSHCDHNDGFCVVSGNPFLECVHDPFDRKKQLKKIAKNIFCGDFSLLSECRGQFSIAAYNKKSSILHLISDANGSRPLYYCFVEGNLFFGTNLNVVSELAKVQGECDWEAEVQSLIFGVPLGNKTVNKKIKVLKNGEMLFFDGDVPRLKQYFRWDSLPENNVDFAELGEDLYNTFVDAVAIRGQSSEGVLAALSGGLDSRCVVAILKDLGKDIKSFNFSNPGEKDIIYARAYANDLNINLHEVKRPKKSWSWGGLIADAIKNTDENKGSGSSGRLVFSGDGGSVGLGRVYLEENDLKCLRQNGEGSLAKQFVTDNRRMPPVSYLSQQKGTEIVESLIEAMRQELNAIDCPDTGKKLFLFFLQNDQRRHLHHHYENILNHKIELLVPFMDKKFNDLVVSAPSDMFLFHTFYHKWLKFFPDTTRAVPWQTYPGHVECPVSNSEISGVDQWVVSKRNKWNVDCLFESVEMIKLTSVSGVNLRAAGVKRGRLFAACLAHACGIVSYNYLFNFIKALNKSSPVRVID